MAKCLEGLSCPGVLLIREFLLGLVVLIILRSLLMGYLQGILDDLLLFLDDNIIIYSLYAYILILKYLHRLVSVKMALLVIDINVS